MRKKHLIAIVVVLALGIGLAGCSKDSKTAKPTTTTTAADVLAGTIVVSAATSLTAAFSKIADDFKADHPNVAVTFNFGASSGLASQITSGAPVDVFASADAKNMLVVTGAKFANSSTTFARNKLVIVTKPGNPKAIKTLADLSSNGVISLCAIEVPCGSYATQVLTGANVTIPESRITRGQNVAAALTAVTDGDAVAGIVYATDAIGVGDKAAVVVIPDARNVIATYPIARLTASKHAGVADAFIAFVLGERGQRALVKLGFLPRV